jgi:hypothetical protein
MIHVQVWCGSACARITDMTNAGKRGKLCETLRFSGAPWSHGSHLNPLQQLALDHTSAIVAFLRLMAPQAENGGELVDFAFSAVRDSLRAKVATARTHGVPEGYVALYEESIKGIKAPRQVLTAGVAGVWGGHADEDGISLSDLKDPNMWREITHHDQSRARAYEIAAKVWPQVQQAKTLHDAAEILRAAGARLHGYCGMD